MSEKIERREFLKFLITSGIVLTNTGGMSSIFSGCEKGKEVTVDRTYDFLDHLNEAEVASPQKKYVRRSSFTIGGKAKKVLYEHPDSQVTFKKVPIYKNARLTFGIGINEPAWDKEGDGVLFEIIITDEKSQKHPLYSRYIDPKNNPEDRKWFDELIDLKAFEGKKVSFTFKTSSGPKENKASDWAGWNEPRITSTIRKKVKSGEKTNVILITVDTLRADYLNCYGKKDIRTPNINKLASQGVMFRNCFCQSSTTNPSHASILTSLYPKDHRVHTNTDYLSKELRMISQDMQDQGFNTFATVSASHLNPKISGFGRGFNTFITCEKPQVIASVINRNVFTWLKENYKSRFFMWLHYFDPHAPYTPPEPYKKMYYAGNPRDPNNDSMQEVAYPDRWINTKHIEWLNGVTDINYPISQYMGEVSFLDEQIGQLLQKLNKYGLENNTMIIFTSDHGESLNEHHIYFAHAGLYEVTIKVPLIIWFPQKFGHKAVESLVMSVDIMPTVLDFFGLEFPSGIRGKSFLPILHGKEEEIHEQIFCEHVSKTQAMIRNEKWKYIKSLRNWRFSKKFLFTNGDRELYDLTSDPEELKNIADNYPEITEKFDQQLVAWLKDKKAITKPVKTPEVKEEVKERLRALGYLQ